MRGVRERGESEGGWAKDIEDTVLRELLDFNNNNIHAGGRGAKHGGGDGRCQRQKGLQDL